MQCVCVVQLNCVKVQCMAYRKVGVCCRVYLFWLFISLIAWGEKAIPQSASAGSDAAETSSRGQQREQSVRWVAGVLDDPPGFPYTPPGVDVLEGGKLTFENKVQSAFFMYRYCYRLQVNYEKWKFVKIKSCTCTCILCVLEHSVSCRDVIFSINRLIINI